MTSRLRISRRSLLAAAPFFGLSALWSSRAHADAPATLTTTTPTTTAPTTNGTTVHVASRVVRIVADVRGITATLELDHAPFPMNGAA